MKKQQKRRLRDMSGDQLVKRYSYLQSKPFTKDSRQSKYVLYHLRRRGLK